MKTLSITIALIFISQVAHTEIRGLEVKQRVSEQLRTGKQYVYIIAINNYAEWSHLKNPVKDATEIRNILQSDYYIDTVVELYDKEATKSNILRKFGDLQKLLKSEDSLLIFYAGHGYFDRRLTNSGFWIPTNGGTDIFEQANWISNSQIRALIGNFKASHICLISDSCFSGDILNAMRGDTLTGGIDDESAAKVYLLTSRQVLTSGAEEAVPDNSEFSQQLKMALQKNKEPYLDPLTLYAQIRKGVRSTLPLLGNLKDTGHQEGASFFLFSKPNLEEMKANNHVSLEPHILTGDNQILPKRPMFAAVGAGLLVPVIEAAGNIDLGFGSSLSLGFSFPIPSGYFGFAVFTGLSSGEAWESPSSTYVLYSIPLGGLALYEFEIVPAFRILVEVGGGESLNLLYLANGYAPMIYTPFVLGAFGGEFIISPEWAIGISGRCSLQFFSNIVYANITPVIFFKASFGKE